MSSENYVGIIMAENLRFPGEGSSAQGKPGAKARPRGVVDAHTVEIPYPPYTRKLTLRDNRTRPLVAPGERDRTTSREVDDALRREKAKYGARTANRHR